MTEDKRYILSEIISHKEAIKDHLDKIENLLKSFFPKEHDMAYQHYIPQILTAINAYDKWLSRGSYTLENTIKNISDNIDSDNKKSGVKKFIN